jgi:hypothetical protein
MSTNKDLIDSRHYPNTGIKRVIKPNFVPLKSKNWFNDHSLFFVDLSSFVILGQDFFKGEGCNTPGVL